MVTGIFGCWGRGWKATKVLPKKEVFCDWSDHRIQTKMRTTMTY